MTTISSVRLLTAQGDDRQRLLAFYLAHAQGRLRQRVESGSLSLDPRCQHVGGFDAQGELRVAVQMLAARGFERTDHWLTFFEAHTVPGGAARQLLLFQPVAPAGAAGRQALGELLDEVVRQAGAEPLDALLLAVAPERLNEFEQHGFSVYTNGRHGSGTGFLVPMARLVAPAGAEPSAPAQAWLAGVKARRQHFLVHDPSRAGVGPGLMARLGWAR